MFSRKIIFALLVSSAAFAEPAFAQGYRFRVASPGVLSAAAPTTPAAPAAPVIATVANGAWSDGTFARSCIEYLTGDATHTPTNANGVYSIKPAATTYSVTCDMTGGGWTRFDFMIGGAMPSPGDYANVFSQRVQASYLTMYKEIAAVSAQQKLYGVTGASEPGYDLFSFLTQNQVLVAGTVEYSGGLNSKDLLLAVNGNWQNAFGYTRYRTDGSSVQGLGANIPAQSWFK
jgi:hypothetical protein